MKICAFSDIHGNINFNVEECEVVFICGDIIPLMIQRDLDNSYKWLSDKFLPWINSFPCKKVFVIAGNHDFIFEKNPTVSIGLFEQKQYRDKIIFLNNENYRYTAQNGVTYKIFGTPWCHQFGNWAFMDSDEELIKKYDNIDVMTDILISHDTPYGACDQCLGFNNEEDRNLHRGNKVLRQIIKEAKPKYVFCGHLHTGNHDAEYIEDTKVINVSLLDEGYEMIYKPLIMEI